MIKPDRLARARTRSVMIATPVARDPVWQYTIGLMETALALRQHGIPMAVQFVVGSSNLPRARNELVARFLASQASDLLFIDDDMGWRADDALNLLGTEQPFVGGLGRKRVDKPNDVRGVWCGAPEEDANGRLTSDAQGLVKFKKVGTGFLKLSREVFERVIDARPDLKAAGHDGMSEDVKSHYYRLFAFGSDEHEAGEDFLFCETWKSLGGEVWVDPEIWLSHVGSKEYSGCIADHMTDVES